MTKANQNKADLLGMHHSTAHHRLVRMVMLELIIKLDLDKCFRCNKKIETVKELSIEHKESWQSAIDPLKSFFNIDNISFSHLSCNVKAGRKGMQNKSKTFCKRGHQFDQKNTYIEKKVGNRHCRECLRIRIAGIRNVKKFGPMVEQQTRLT